MRKPKKVVMEKKKELLVMKCHTLYNAYSFLPFFYILYNSNFLLRILPCYFFVSHFSSCYLHVFIFSFVLCQGSSASHVIARSFIDTEALVEDDDEEDESETEELKHFSDDSVLEPDNEIESEHLKRRFYIEAFYSVKLVAFIFRKLDVELPSRKEYRGSKTHLQTTIGDLERRYQDQTGTDDEAAVSEDDVDYDSEHQEEDDVHDTYRYRKTSKLKFS
jgi:hypothetical protein